MAYGDPQLTNDIDLILDIRKLEFFQEGGSEKHLRDIAAMVAESGVEIELAYLDQETRARGLSAAWQQACAMAQK